MELRALVETNQALNRTDKAVLRCILYFDIFNHPLTSEEIFFFLPAESTKEENLESIKKLITEGFVKEFAGFIFSALSNPSIIEKRIIANKRAEEAMGKVLKYCRLISKFPFVEGLCISGSLSKGVMEKDGDADYFVITKPSRLWLCRSLLIIYKKIFLLNSRKYFCVNYFVDSDNLEIPDQNLFVAHEISTLLPVYSYETYSNFIKINSWTKEYLPAAEKRKNLYCFAGKSGFKRTLERVLNGKTGEHLDNFFFRLTLKRWKKKFSHFNEQDFDLHMRTRKTVSKHHPRGYQEKVLLEYGEKIKATEQYFGVRLETEPA
jgi:hypothetical protein